MKTVAEVLRGTVEVLDEHGWCRGHMQDRRGRYCVFAAIYVAAGGEAGAFDPAGLAWRARSVLRRQIGGGSIVRWNDERGRRARDVKAALLAAAERAEARA